MVNAIGLSTSLLRPTRSASLTCGRCNRTRKKVQVDHQRSYTASKGTVSKDIATRPNWQEPGAAVVNGPDPQRSTQQEDTRRAPWIAKRTTTKWHRSPGCSQSLSQPISQPSRSYLIGLDLLEYTTAALSEKAAHSTSDRPCSTTLTRKQTMRDKQGILSP